MISLIQNPVQPVIRCSTGFSIMRFHHMFFFWVYDFTPGIVFHTKIIQSAKKRINWWLPCYFRLLLVKLSRSVWGLLTGFAHFENKLLVVDICWEPFFPRLCASFQESFVEDSLYCGFSNSYRIPVCFVSFSSSANVSANKLGVVVAFVENTFKVFVFVW